MWDRSAWQRKNHCWNSPICLGCLLRIIPIKMKLLMMKTMSKAVTAAVRFAAVMAQFRSCLAILRFTVSG